MENSSRIADPSSAAYETKQPNQEDLRANAVCTTAMSVLQATNNESATFALTKQEFINGYLEGVTTGQAYMLEVWEEIEDIPYNYLTYCAPEGDLNKQINKINDSGYERVASVFSMAIDVKEQLEQRYVTKSQCGEKCLWDCRKHFIPNK